MKSLSEQLESNWVMVHLFHKSNVARVKKDTGAYHVIHIKDHKNKNGYRVNCLLIKSKKGEVKYGGAKDFNSWTADDYTNAINSFNDEFTS
jgi:hypothetical protein